MMEMIRYGAVGFLIGLIISLVHRYPNIFNFFGLNLSPISDFVFYITPFLGLVAGLVSWYVVEGRD